MAFISSRIPLGSFLFLRNSYGNIVKQNVDYSTRFVRHCIHANRGIYLKISSRSCVQPNDKYARTFLGPSVIIPSRPQSNGKFDRDNQNNPRQKQITRVFMPVPRPLILIRNWLFGVIIRAYFDSDFTFKQFTEGAKQGLSIISNEMASGELDGISSMVSPKLLPELRDVIGRMSLEQRNRLIVKIRDIVHTLPQKVMVHYDDNGGRFLYILMRFWCLSLETPQEDNQGYSFKIGTPPPGVSQEEFQNPGSIVTCDYEFVREVTPGVTPEWTISHIQHGKLINLEARGYPPS